MKSTLILLTLFCMAKSLFSQQETFQKIVTNTNLNEIHQTSDNGFIAVGWNGAPLAQSACLLKIDEHGDKIWCKSFGEIEDVTTHSVDTTFDHGFIMSGYAYQNNGEGSKMYVIKTNGIGEIEWVKKYGGLVDDASRQVHSTYDGGYIMAGETTSFGAGKEDIYIVKIDSEGKVLWSKTYGGLEDDMTYSLCQTADGGFAILAVLGIWTPNPDIAIIKIDSHGKTLWIKTYVDSHSKIGNQIIQTADHGLAIGGGDIANNSDFYLLLTDSLGNLKWSKYYGSNEAEGAYSLAQTSDGGFILAGNSYISSIANPCTLKLNASGAIDWCTGSITADNGVTFSVIQASDGGYLLAGQQYELIKLDSKGASPCSASKYNVTAKEVSPVVSDISLVETSPNTITTNSVSVIRPEVDIIVVCNSVGTKNPNSREYLEIVPNPAKDYFSIKLENLLNEAHIEIYDILGNKVYSAIENNLEHIDCHQLPSGIYIVKLKLGEMFYSSKLIIGR